MPKASVNEYHGIPLWEYKVGAPRKMLGMKAVTQAARVQRASDDLFWLCVLCAYTGHHPAARSLVDNICHSDERSYSLAGRGNATALLSGARAADIELHK